MFSKRSVETPRLLLHHDKKLYYKQIIYLSTTQGRRGSQIGPGKLYARGPLLGGGV